MKFILTNLLCILYVIECCLKDCFMEEQCNVSLCPWYNAVRDDKILIAVEVYEQGSFRKKIRLPQCKFHMVNKSKQIVLVSTKPISQEVQKYADLSCNPVLNS